MNTQFESLAATLRTQFPDARVKLETFPSGAYWLDFIWRKRLWELVYLPSHQEFGVDEIKKEEGFGTGYNHVFDNFEAAQNKFLELLEPCVAIDTLVAA